jgi:hypothetical protein
MHEFEVGKDRIGPPAPKGFYAGGGQTALRGAFERALDRIHRGAGGMPVRLFPYARKATQTSGLPSVIAIDPKIAFGRPKL